MFVLKREQVEHARLRALAQSIISKEKGVEAFDEYHKVAFPWLEAQARRSKDEAIRLLNEEVSRGGLAVRPLWERPMRSRLRTQAAAAARRRTPDELDALYAKLGKAGR